jgi:hypothetical protein
MTRSMTTRLVCAGALTIGAVLGGASASAAADDPTVLTFAAGEACVFALRVEIRGGTQVFKEFRDKDGKVVRTLSAGKGSALTFTNLATNATLSLDANGSVSQVTSNNNGLQTFVTTGHNVLILFPTDVPAGPSTTLTVGRVVFTVDTSNGVFTLKEVSGLSTDICAALS